MKAQIKNKIGFLWYTPDLYFHHRPILDLLPHNSFEIVVYRKPAQIIPLLKQKGYPYAMVEDVLAQQIRYRAMISNHYVTKIGAIYQGQEVTSYLPRALSQMNIRLMYSLANDTWNYAPWNHSYDLHLCFGPWQARQLSFCKSRILEVGYPRYDPVFNQPIDKRAWLTKLNCDPAKQTLVWMPSQIHHSITEFAKPLALLSDKYNVIVKTHPLQVEFEKPLLEDLKYFPFTTLIFQPMDLAILFQLADFVLADYGGPAFGAIYLDKKLLLLDNPKVESTLPPNATETYIRQFIVHIEAAQADLLPQIFENHQLWQAQRHQRAWLQKQFFAPYFGNAAARVCDILLNLDAYLTLGE